MNVFTFTHTHIAARAFAILALFALVASLFPGQVSAQNAGAIWTNVGPCGSPQNVNLYEVGQDFYVNGSGFNANQSYTWIMKEPGNNKPTIETGVVFSDENGNVCEKLFTLEQRHVGGPYQFKFGDVNKNDNFRVAASSNQVTTGTLTVNKILNDTERDENDFGFKVGEATVMFNENGTGQLTLPLAAYSVTEIAKSGIDLNDYDVQMSTGCSGTMTAGGATCTITNTLIENDTTLTLLKEVSGGDASANDWRLIANGPMGFSGAGEATRTIPFYEFNDIAVPTWTLTEEVVDSESSITDGYTAGLWECTGNSIPLDGDDLTLVAGENVTCTITNTYGTPPPQLCTVEIFSNTSTFVVEKDLNALALSTINSGWSALIPGATWIWGDNPVIDSTVNETQTFVSKFGFVGSITSATLAVASDNSHSATLNTVAAGASAVENNFQSVKQYDVTSLIAQGNNELSIAVMNWALDGSTPENNPAGLLFKLTIEGVVTTDADCSVSYREPEVEEDEYEIFGYVWNDENRDTIWNLLVNEEEVPEGESSLAGWTVQATNGVITVSTVTGEDGYYSLLVPAGTWTVSQIVPAGWEQTTEPDSYIVTVPTPVESASILETIFNFIIPVAHAAILERVGPLDFGNAVVDTTNGGGTTATGGGGGGRGGGTPLRSTPTPQVGGVSDSVPTPMVLGEQVTAVPTGAPNTGAGGAAPIALDTIQFASMALLTRSRRDVR